MGQKVNPIGIRLRIVRNWDSLWYSEGEQYADQLNEDIKVRQYLKKLLTKSAVSRIQIERLAKKPSITIYSGRPGTIIGKKGDGIQELRTKMAELLKTPVLVNIEEVRKPELDATLVAESIAQQLEHRIMFRRAMKRAVSNAMRQGALGIKVGVSGRLGGAEIARSEMYREGRVPLHTFRADIDYGTARANTTYGVIGVKVWIFKREVIPGSEEKEVA